MLLIIDNYDSFTFNLVDYFRQLDQEVEVTRNDTNLSDINWGKYSGIILSPGPGTPRNSNNLLSFLAHCIKLKLPVLGICLGHQAIAEHFGFELVLADKPMHGKVSEIEHFNDKLFNNIPCVFNAVRYHSIIINSIKTPLQTICSLQDGTIMGIKHKTFPLYGIQYHPESILTNYGLKLLENWLLLNNIK